MTISSERARVIHLANKEAASYTFPFKIFKESEVRVVLISPEGRATKLFEAKDYTASGLGEDSGGAVILSQELLSQIKGGEKIVISRQMSFTQEVDYRPHDLFPAETHERALDILTMQCQELRENLARAILANEDVTEPITYQNFKDLITLAEAKIEEAKTLALEAKEAAIAAAAEVLEQVEAMAALDKEAREKASAELLAIIKKESEAAQAAALEAINQANLAILAANEAKLAAELSSLKLATSQEVSEGQKDSVAVSPLGAASVYARKEHVHIASEVGAYTKEEIDGKIITATPAGAVSFFAQSTAPSGWLKANGATLSRTTYGALFKAIGTTFGAGDGTSTFKIPDLRGEFLRGWDDGRKVDSGRIFGSAQGDAIRNITGAMNNSGKFWYNGDPIFSGALAQTLKNPSPLSSGANWSNGGVRFDFDASRVVPTANENRPRNVALLACIKY